VCGHIYSKLFYIQYVYSCTRTRSLSCFFTFEGTKVSFYYCSVCMSIVRSYVHKLPLYESTKVPSKVRKYESTFVASYTLGYVLPEVQRTKVRKYEGTSGSTSVVRTRLQHYTYTSSHVAMYEHGYDSRTCTCTCTAARCTCYVDSLK
jgi:hypothetical protein